MPVIDRHSFIFAVGCGNIDQQLYSNTASYEAPFYIEGASLPDGKGNLMQEEVHPRKAPYSGDKNGRNNSRREWSHNVASTH